MKGEEISAILESVKSASSNRNQITGAPLDALGDAGGGSGLIVGSLGHLLGSIAKAASGASRATSAMDPRLPNNITDANLRFVLELQRQQQQQQAAQQQQQQQHQLAQQQQKQQQQPTTEQDLLADLQALLMQQRQQPSLNQANIQFGFGGLSRPLGGSNDLGAALQQRETAMANQLLTRQQNLDVLLASAARTEQQRSATTPLSALFLSSPGDPLQQALQMQLAAVRSQNFAGPLVPQTENQHLGEQLLKEATSELGAASEESKLAAAKKEETSESEVEEDEAAEDEEDHPANDTFPFKLHRMLEHAEKNDLDDVISFSEEGKSFSIHKPRDFVSGIMPKYFTTSRMSSFQRQLNLYGFRRVTEGRDKGSYFHKYFVKGRRGLCKKIKRKKASAKSPQAYDGGIQAQNSMSIRQLLAERQLGSAYSGLAAAPVSGLDASHMLANAQLHHQLELLVRQKQEEARQQQQFPFGRFPPGGGSGGFP
jgi:hypothetical protein